MRHYKYLIIGNSAGGIGAAEAIRKTDKEGSMAIISDEEHHVYGRPLISYYLGDEIDYDKIFYRPFDFYDKKKIDAILGKKAVKVDFDRSIVTLDDAEEIEYEKLLLATGGTPFVPPIKGLDKYEHFSFITLDDSLKIRERLSRKKIETAIVLGGGLIGLKAAEALTMRGINVKVVELADRVLSPVLDEQASAIIQDVVESEGVEVITGHTFNEVVGNGGMANGVIMDTGVKIDCGLVIIAIGVRPRIDLVKDSPVKLNRGIVVNKHMETNIPNVYACGDCAEVYDFLSDNFRLTPLWPTAYVGGNIAGHNMAGNAKEYVWGTGMNAVDFFGFPVISAGYINPPEGQEMEVLTKIEPENMTYKKFLIQDNRIMGMIFVNEVDRAGVILGLMRDKVDVSSFKDDLLRIDFGAVHLPIKLREEINTAAV
ncbi:NAD(P)/FAD-dependent oxidoreductase [Candidatus Poribacteria bacterium]|nr:NAD(P)/FAD-dependent oxidoreductase [Candidatus Poribacteria bacterium]